MTEYQERQKKVNDTIEAYYAKYQAGEEISGSYENGIKWVLTQEHILTISGEGPIPKRAFGTKRNDDNLLASQVEEIRILDGITEVGESAFCAFKELKRVELPETLKVLDNYCFECCCKLEEINFPASLKYIGNYAFRKCTSLEEVSMHCAVRFLRKECFENCTALRKAEFPENLVKVEWGAFYGCTALEEMILPDSVTEMEGSIFKNCIALKKAVLPKELKILPHGIFAGCTSLSEIVLPDTISLIKEEAFADCASLEEFKLPENIFVVEPSSFDNAGCEGNVTYPATCKRLFANTMFSKKNHQKHIDIPEGIQVLEERCFAEYTDLETITFPKSLKQIKKNCFKGCSNLKEVKFAEGMDIGWYSFWGCTSLKEIEIPENCKVGEGAFIYCNELVSVRLPQNASINNYAFADCPSLKDVYAPENSSYYWVYRMLPTACRIRNLEGKELLSMRLRMDEHKGEIPEEVLPELEKLEGMNLEEQLNCCYVITRSGDETYSYGESEGVKNYDSRIPLANYSRLRALLVKEGNIVGIVGKEDKIIYPGQLCEYYSSSETDGTGSRYVSNESYFVIMK